MANPQLVRDLIDAGIHFGHRTSRWNPKMKPYIYGKRNLIHIIDVRETLKGILAAQRFLSRVVASGRDVLFVGTKRQARAVIDEVGKETNMPVVTERWLGGTLTNYRTIRSRLARLEELEKILQSPDLNKSYSKKMESSLKREYRKILRNLSGIRIMDRLPGALFVVDVKREHIAIQEARKLEIPVVAIIDTDSDPDVVDIAIPANDDALRGIDLIMREISAAVLEGKSGRVAREEQDKAQRSARGDRPERRRRPTSVQAQDQLGAEKAGDVAVTTVSEPATPPEPTPTA
ncbi:MAG TPA: 30S ribosomal protein S2 [Phycisphaerae bacterium]|nr:30S ribosomal protein S2 [Phycisphaerae bacterium]